MHFYRRFSGSVKQFLKSYHFRAFLISCFRGKERGDYTSLLQENSSLCSSFLFEGDTYTPLNGRLRSLLSPAPSGKYIRGIPSPNNPWKHSNISKKMLILHYTLKKILSLLFSGRTEDNFTYSRAHHPFTTKKIVCIYPGRSSDFRINLPAAPSQSPKAISG